VALKRVPIGKVHIKRTIRPLYAFSQATPKAGFLDPAFDRSSKIWPGMCAMKTEGDNYTLINGTGVPAGLFAHYIGGDGIDELEDQGINALAVWVLGPDAEFEILAPAFDASVSWDDPGDGTDVLIGARTVNAAGATATEGLRGQLVPAGTAGGSSNPVARLIKVVSASKIVIGGLMPGR
jgi:hypothetical protein